MNYLKRAVELSQHSLEAGEFPAGAVLVTKSGAVYESKPSLPYNHGEMMVIDAAIAAEGFPLTDAVVYASMQSCLMCSAKMYWSGIKTVHYVIPKSKTSMHYAYENNVDTEEVAKNFYTPVTMTHMPDQFETAMDIYERWVRTVEK